MIQPINHDQTSLQQVSQPATSSDDQVARDLIDTLQAHRDNCVGMAANMIGIHKRIIAVSLGPATIAMLNPQIISKNGQYQTTEGCLSLSGERPTTRFQHIVVRFEDLQHHRRTLPLDGWAAEIVQHEIDHCNGILI